MQKTNSVALSRESPRAATRRSHRLPPAGFAAVFIFRAAILVQACLLSVSESMAAAEPKEAEIVSPPGFKLSDPQTYRMTVILRVDAPHGPARNVTATGPVPIDWPEQKVRLVSETKPPGSKTKLMPIAGRAGMLAFWAPYIPAGGSVAVEQVYEITRYRIRFQVDPSDLVKAEKLSRELRSFLGPAPGVETKDRRIVQLVESLTKPDADAWTTTRAHFDWVRRNVKYVLGKFQGATYALDKKTGDCEDMTALFVAMCRISGIPARTVWIEDHAYPEFYLEDKQGRGYWIPAQVSGPPWFGEMAEQRPILQKGDRFRDDLRRRYVRYVPQTARAQGGPVRLISSRTLPPDIPQQKPQTDD